MTQLITPKIDREELWNSISHGIGAVIAIIGFVFLIIYASVSKQDWALFSSLFYGISLIAVYTSSAIYHGLHYRSATSEMVKQIWQKIDHGAIFLLIAGSYTPFSLVTIGGTLGWTIFGLQWSLALIGIFFKICCFDKMQYYSLWLYISMGWLALPLIGYLYQNLPIGGLILVLLGGVVYTLGTIFYALDRKLPYAHFIWHLFVIGGSSLHYLCIFWYIV